MKKTAYLAVMACVGAALAWAPASLAADAAARDANVVTNVPGMGASTIQLMSHGQLAELLVRKLGLFRLLPANATPLDCMMILSQQGIYPSPSLSPTEQNPTPGWNLDAKAEVTLSDLSVLIVRSLGMEGKVQGDRNDPQNWINVLNEVQVSTASIGSAVATTSPLGQVLVNLPIFEVTQDPLAKRFVPIDTTTGVINSMTVPNLGSQLPTGVMPPPGETGPTPMPATPN